MGNTDRFTVRRQARPDAQRSGRVFPCIRIDSLGSDTPVCLQTHRAFKRVKARARRAGHNIITLSGSLAIFQRIFFFLLCMCVCVCVCARR